MLVFMVLVLLGAVVSRDFGALWRLMTSGADVNNWRYWRKCEAFTPTYDSHDPKISSSLVIFRRMPGREHFGAKHFSLGTQDL